MVYEKIPPAGIRIYTDAIPDHVYEDFAVAMLNFVRRTMQESDTREKSEASIHTKKESL